MGRHFQSARLVVIGVIVVACAACGTETPTEQSPAPPSIRSFSPESLYVDASVGDTILFSIRADDSAAGPLRYSFSIRDSVASRSSTWAYVVVDSGPITVTGRVSNGGAESSITWELQRRAAPDTIAPARVTVTELFVRGRTPRGFELVILWGAVGDDSMQGLPLAYDLRHAEEPITSESAWLAAVNATGEPRPADPGSEQVMLTTVGLFPDSLWVAVRAVDEAGNRSPLGNTLPVGRKEISGTIYDAVTNAPLPGITIRVDDLSTTTGSDGGYTIKFLFPKQLAIRDEADPADYGAYFDIVAAGDKGGPDFWMIPNLPLETTRYPDFLTWFKAMTNTATNPRGNLLRTWPIPYDVYVPPKVRQGIDFQQQTMDAINVWESSTGMDLVRFVDAEPLVGVFVTFRPDNFSGSYWVHERDADWFPTKAEIQLRTFPDSASIFIFDRRAAHEGGHAMGMAHSTDAIHLMVAGQGVVVDQPNTDEIQLLKAMYHLPRGTSLDAYVLD